MLCIHTVYTIYSIIKSHKITRILDLLIVYPHDIPLKSYKIIKSYLNSPYFFACFFLHLRFGHQTNSVVTESPSREERGGPHDLRDHEAHVVRRRSGLRLGFGHQPGSLDHLGPSWTAARLK
jgi:hypothetical protein